MHALVLTVSDICAAMTQSVPPFLMLHVTGVVPTTGWTGGQLVPAVYYAAPADGVWGFQFMAQRPDGIVSQVLTPIAATLTIELPHWCRGVRISASTNELEQALLGGPRPDRDGDDAPSCNPGLAPGPRPPANGNPDR